jgi:hypothetical protein
MANTRPTGFFSPASSTLTSTQSAKGGVGDDVRVLVGLLVGFSVGLLVGGIVGLLVGLLVGFLVGMLVGLLVGGRVGLLVGILVGALVGFSVGLLVGCSVGLLVGGTMGLSVGLVVEVGGEFAVSAWQIGTGINEQCTKKKCRCQNQIKEMRLFESRTVFACRELSRHIRLDMTLSQQVQSDRDRSNAHCTYSILLATNES